MREKGGRNEQILKEYSCVPGPILGTLHPSSYLIFITILGGGTVTIPMP